MPISRILCLAIIVTLVIGGCRWGYGPPCQSDAECDDHNPCTDDSCVSPEGCVHLPNQAPCDDGDDCSGHDVCEQGACAGGPVDRDTDADGYLEGACPGGDDCDDQNAAVHPGAEESPGAGTCQDRLDNDCDGLTDGQEPLCQVCQPGEACDDGLFCNGSDSCDAQSDCTVHDGDPCGGPECLEDQDECRDEDWFDLDGSDLGHLSEQVGGSSWGGGISTSPGASWVPAMALDASGRPVVVWAERIGGQYDIWVMRFDGFGWAELGAGSASSGGISDTPDDSWFPAVALDASGNPVVAWEEVVSSDNSEIYVKRYDGNSWVELGTGSAGGGGISQNAGESEDPCLVLDGSDQPVVAWSDDTNGEYHIYIKTFRGGSWEEYDVGTASGVGITLGAGNSQFPALALDDSGHAVLAWQYSEGGAYGIHIRRFNGSAWVEVGTNSASGGGISQNSALSGIPSLVLDADDNPVVAWHDSDSGIHEIYVLRFDGTNWQEIGTGSASGGGISQTQNFSSYPSLALDGSGTPLVAWTEATDPDLTQFEIYLKRFDGAGWVEVSPGSASGGGVSANAGESFYPTLAVDPLDNLLLVWDDTASGNREIYLKRFDGNAWSELGPEAGGGQGLSQSPGLSRDPSLCMNPDGQPLVAWTDEAPGASEIYLRIHDGTAWNELAGSASGPGVSGSPEHSESVSLALGPGGAHNPVAAWGDSSSGTSEIFVKRFEGNAWVELGVGSASGVGISTEPGGAFYPSAALDSAGNPVVAWSAFIGNIEIHVMRFDGTNWVEVGTGSATSGGISDNSGPSWNPAVVVDSMDNPVIAWFDFGNGNEIFVKRFDGADWVDVGSGSSSGEGISATDGNSLFPALALDQSDNPVVAWQDDTPGNKEIYVRKSEGGSWIELGPDSASAGGISQSPGESQLPALAMDASDLPVVAWSDDTPGSTEIYIKRFDGSQWEELTPGSAQGGGISNSTSTSLNVTLGIRNGRICAAWDEGGPAGQEIILRCMND